MTSKVSWTSSHVEMVSSPSALKLPIRTKRKMVSEKHRETLGIELWKHNKCHTRQRTIRNITVSKWCLAHLVYILYSSEDNYLRASFIHEAMPFPYLNHKKAFKIAEDASQCDLLEASNLTRRCRC
jgi:hypothetical protein